MTDFKLLYTSMKANYFKAYSKGVSYKGKYMSSADRYFWFNRILEYEEFGYINKMQADILIEFVDRNARTNREETVLLINSVK